MSRTRVVEGPGDAGAAGDVWLAAMRTLLKAELNELSSQIAEMNGRLDQQSTEVSIQFAKINERLDRHERQYVEQCNSFERLEKRFDTMNSFPHVVRQSPAEYASSVHSVSGSKRIAVRFIR